MSWFLWSLAVIAWVLICFLMIREAWACRNRFGQFLYSCAGGAAAFFLIALIGVA